MLGAIPCSETMTLEVGGGDTRKRVSWRLRGQLRNNCDTSPPPKRVERIEDTAENEPPGLGSDWMQGTQERGPGHEGLLEMDKTTVWISIQILPPFPSTPNTGEGYKRHWTDVC